MTDVIICGGGAAGLSAAIYCARAGLTTQVFCEMPGGQTLSAEKIENYPGFLEIDGFTLMDNMRRQAEVSGAEIRMEPIEKINLDEKSVNGEKAKAIILAMGANHRKLGLSNEEALTGKGVSYCATCDGNFYRGKTVAVVGGGNTALSDAIYLAKICEKVYLIHRRGEFRAEKRVVDTLNEYPNIEKVLNANVMEICETDGLVSGIKTENAEIKCNALFVAIGTDPNVSLIDGQIELENGIVTNKFMQTSREGVFAAGDITDTNQKQVVTAAGDGAKAAKSAIEYILGT
ncbi:MAG: FAD-dependent oxidoreductase [Clostridia bacterium]|nr:FAD-dependent oxidoreductase [Clostridia bacterium]